MRILIIFRYETLASFCGINQSNLLLKATLFLSKIGSIVYFSNTENENLKKIIILDPEWIYSCINALVTKNLGLYNFFNKRLKS